MPRVETRSKAWSGEQDGRTLSTKANASPFVNGFALTTGATLQCGLRDVISTSPPRGRPRGNACKNLDDHNEDEFERLMKR